MAIRWFGPYNHDFKDVEHHLRGGEMLCDAILPSHAVMQVVGGLQEP